MRKKSFVFIFTILFLLSILVLSSVRISNKEMSASTSFLAATNQDRIHFINVGDGDSILIESNGEYGLVDAGHLEAKVSNYLNLVLGSNKKLKYIMVTHSHSDHTGGMLDVIKSFVDSNTVLFIGDVREKTVKSYHDNIVRETLNKDGSVVEYGSKIKTNGKYDKYNYEVTSIDSSGNITKNDQSTKVKTELTIGNFLIYNLNRERDVATISGTNPSSDDNRNSFIQLVYHKLSNKKVLLAADMEDDDETRFLCTTAASDAGECRTETKKLPNNSSITEKNLIKNCDILKLGHHGLYTSSQNSFLAHVNPTYAIISNFKGDVNESKFRFNAFKYLAENNKKMYVTAYDMNDYVDFNGSSSQKSIIAKFSSSSVSLTDSNGNAIQNVDLSLSYDPSNHDPNDSSTPYWTTFTWNGKTAQLQYDANTKIPSKQMHEVDGKCYMFHKITGVQLKTWKQQTCKVDNKTVHRFYYFRSKVGTRVTGSNKEIDDVTYNFDSGTNCSCDEGYLIGSTSWTANNKTTGLLKTTAKRWFYIDKSEVYAGWKTLNNKKYYFYPYDNHTSQSDYGLMQVGLEKIPDENDSQSSHYYFFLNDSTSDDYGVMQTGWVKTGGETYYFKKSTGEDHYGVTYPKGAALNGWQIIGDNKFYFKKGASMMLTGFIEIGGKTYYFKKTGEFGVKGSLLTGLIKTGGETYYLKPSNEDSVEKGMVLTGWQKVDGNMYYFRPQAEDNYLFGSAIRSQTKTIDGISYTFDENGICKNYNGTVAKPTTSNCINPTYNGSTQKIISNKTGYTFSNNSKKDVGEYTVTATLSLGYAWSDLTTDTVSFKCSIKAKSIASATVEVANQTYTGSALTPAPTVKDGAITLVSGTDYTVSYSNNVEVGTATVTITGKGNYTGTATGSFTISSTTPELTKVDKPTTDKCSNPTYNGTDQVITTPAGTGYSFINNLYKDAGTHSVTARLSEGYVWQDDTTSDYTFNCSINTKDISSTTIEIPNQTYTGSALTPEPIVKDESTTLTNGTDYTVSYSNNIDVGIATITITGKGNYTSSNEGTFEILLPIELDITILDENNVIIDENNLIVNIPTGTKITRTNFVSMVNIPSNFTLKDKNNNTITDDNTGVGTNAKIESDDKTYIIVVKGDASGEGEISTMDLINIYGHMNAIDKERTSNLDEYQILAADYNNDNVIDIRDLINVYGVIKAND